MPAESPTGKQRYMGDAPIPRNKGKVMAFASSVIWVNTWMFLPFIGFGAVWKKFSIKHAAAWWVTFGVLMPKLPQLDSVRNFFFNMKYWIDGLEIIGSMKDAYTGEKPIVLCHHPHGAVSINGCAIGGLHKDAPAVAAPAVFMMPFCRQLMNLVGCIPSDKKSFTEHMKAGRNLSMIPGGVDEVVLSDQHAERVFLKKRKGFVKYALQYGYDLVPIYHLGETTMFDALWPTYKETFVRIRLWIAQKTGVALCFGVGCRFFPNIPKRNHKCVTVIGERMVLPMLENPSAEDVTKYHNVYMDKLLEMYNKNRHRVPGFATRELEIW